MAFPNAWLDELMQKNEIVSVISAYTELKPKGRRLWGLCPLHGEKTPSFSVSPDKQMFYCFGCHAGGSVIQFVMQADRLSYFEAVQKLAERVGMELPERVDSEQLQRERAYKARLYDALRAAARYYCGCFTAPVGEAARAYAVKRGLNKEIVLRFGVGYAPDGWDGLKRELLGQGYSEQELIDAGLLNVNREKHSSYDAFRDRLIFPIQSAEGKVLGFGARVMGDEKPKYINTGDTPVYNKRNNLYGLNLQKRADKPDLVMVEGYMDVIGLYKAGVTNAVASLGTALTNQQAQLLKSYHAETIYIAYDGDAAGQSAMLRGMDILAGKGLNVRVIRFPDDLDPDEYVQVYGREGFERLKESAVTHHAFLLETYAKDVDFTDENAREAYALRCCRYIATLQPVEHERYIKQVAERTGYDTDTLRAQLGRGGGEETPLRRYSAGGVRRRATEEADARESAERLLTAAALRDEAALMAFLQGNGEQLLRKDAYKRVLKARRAAGAGFSLSKYVAEIETEEAESVAALLSAEGPEGNALKQALDCMKRLDLLNKREELNALQERLGDPACPNEEKQELLRRIMTLTKATK